MSVYGSKVDDISSDNNSREFHGLPVYHKHGNETFLLDIANQSDDLIGLYKIFEIIIEDGQTYPQESTSLNEFRNYFYSHKTFVVRICKPEIVSQIKKNENDSSIGEEAVAGFYIKPNFPGRSSHLANYGLIVDKNYRGRGIGNFMVENCIILARKLNFRALYTNLVYETNIASIDICKRYGFEQVGRIPLGGYLKGHGFVPALQFYKDLKL